MCLRYPASLLQQEFCRGCQAKELFSPKLHLSASLSSKEHPRMATAGQTLHGSFKGSCHHHQMDLPNRRATRLHREVCEEGSWRGSGAQKHPETSSTSQSKSAEAPPQSASLSSQGRPCSTEFLLTSTLALHGGQPKEPLSRAEEQRDHPVVPNVASTAAEVCHVLIRCRVLGEVNALFYSTGPVCG